MLPGPASFRREKRALRAFCGDQIYSAKDARTWDPQTAVVSRRHKRNPPPRAPPPYTRGTPINHPSVYTPLPGPSFMSYCCIRLALCCCRSGRARLTNVENEGDIDHLASQTSLPFFLCVFGKSCWLTSCCALDFLAGLLRSLSACTKTVDECARKVHTGQATPNHHLSHGLHLLIPGIVGMGCKKITCRVLKAALLLSTLVQVICPSPTTRTNCLQNVKMKDNRTPPSPCLLL